LPDTAQHCQPVYANTWFCWLQHACGVLRSWQQTPLTGIFSKLLTQAFQEQQQSQPCCAGSQNHNAPRLEKAPVCFLKGALKELTNHLLGEQVQWQRVQW
jgi:hypothetical protein